MVSSQYIDFIYRLLGGDSHYRDKTVLDFNPDAGKIAS